jgi:hypothetical protein
VVVALAFLLLVWSGCSSELSPPPPPQISQQETAENDEAPKDTVIRNVLQLIRTAPTNPGGDNFNIAAENLNHYFEGTLPSEFLLAPDARQNLERMLKSTGVRDTKTALQQYQDPKFIAQRDGRHIEDCLLYQGIAARVGGDGDDLTRIQRVFDWIIRQVELVPEGLLAPPNLPHVRARPYDVLLRGMATERGGDWSERSWVFMALCRQLGVDVGLLVFTPALPTTGPLTRSQRTTPSQPVVWACVAAVGHDAYLFDARFGTPIPGPNGKGVATLEQAATDPGILAQLDLPDQEYRPNRRDLGSGELGVFIDSSMGYFAPRMRLLEAALKGKNKMVLYREPAEINAAFAKAIGPRFRGIGLWTMPLMVEYGLFNSGEFVQSTQYSIRLFDSKLPLLAARLDQLRGDLDKAIEDYVSNRFVKNALQTNSKKDLIPDEIQRDLDMYYTYFLALAQLDRGKTTEAEYMFKECLRLLPPLAGRVPPYALYRWGAYTNLGFLNEAKGETSRAARYFSEPVPPFQQHSNLLRARALIFRDPLAIPPPEAEPVTPPSVTPGNPPQPVAAK